MSTKKSNFKLHDPKIKMTFKFYNLKSFYIENSFQIIPLKTFLYQKIIFKLYNQKSFL